MLAPLETIERVDLGDVTLHCAVAGEGPVAILAHGFPDDAGTFRDQVPALVLAGYRVVVPTMRGYAPSGVARSGRYDAAALGADLVGLADRFSPGAPARLVGHDWGAFAAFAATAQAPSRFSHLATIAVPHFRALARHLTSPAQLRRSWYMGLFQLPGVAEARLRARDFALVDELWRDWSPAYHPSADELGAVKDGIRDRVGPVLAYYRALTSARALFGEARRLVLSPVQIPAIHLHGEDDGCIGVECARGAEGFYRSSYTLSVIPGAGHFVQRERPEAVNAALLGLLAR
jgi:pimeloyl-ACP methyl ester carboxylesterase